MPHHRSTTILLAVFAASISAAGDVRAQDPTSIVLNSVDPCHKSPSATVNLNAAAPANGIVVQLNSSAPASAAVPATTTVKEGKTSAEFQITCVPSSQTMAATITATVAGRPGSASTVINVLAPVLSAITIDPHTGINTVNAKATLISQAGPGGVVVTLTSANNKATVPAFVTVPDKATSVTFPIQTKSVPEPTVVSIVGTGLGVSKTADLNILPPRPTGIGFVNKAAPTTLQPTRQVEGSNGSSLRVVLGANSPCCNGLPVQLTSSHPTLITMPSTVTVPTGETGAEFSLTAKPVSQTTNVTITATSGGVSQNCVLTIIPPVLMSFSVTPTKVIGGQNAQGKLFYFTPAPPAGIPVQVFSNNTNLAAVPKQLTVPAGAQELVFPIETNSLENPATVTISVDAAGQKKTDQLDLVPEGPTSVTIPNNQIPGGASAKAFVHALQTTDAFQVILTSSNPAVLTVPNSLSFSSGDTQREFMVSTTPVLQDSPVTISAATTSVRKGGTSFSTTQTNYTVIRTLDLNVKAPVVSEFTLSQSSVTGGGTLSGTVTVSSSAPAGGLPVQVSSDPFGKAGASNSVTIAAGAKSVTFTITTLSVTANTPVYLKARAGNSEKVVGLTLLKP